MHKAGNKAVAFFFAWLLANLVIAPPTPRIARDAAMLGHSDSRLTERVYAKYSPEYLKRAAESLRW